MENQQFHSDVEKMFKSYLSEGEPRIMVAKDGVIITKMPYAKVVFDSDLNIYKIKEDGTLQRVEDPAFSGVVVKS